MATGYRFTVADLESFPDDGRRYEVIDGDLYVTPAPHALHQGVVDQLMHALLAWWNDTELGWAVSGTELEFAEDQDVIPDVVWVSRGRFGAIAGEDGKLHEAPDLVAGHTPSRRRQAARGRRCRASRRVGRGGAPRRPVR